MARKKKGQVGMTKAGKPRRRRAPNQYSAKIAAGICEGLTDGKTLRSICKEAGMPDERSVRRWALDKEHPFYEQYERARFVGYFAMADEIIDISDDAAKDCIERTKDGKTETVVDHENINRSRLRVESRKWLLSKALPKIYGDKLTAEVSGRDGGPIETKDVGPDRLLNLARSIGLILAEADQPMVLEAAE